MLTYTQNITLDINSNSPYPTIGVKQGDYNSRAIVATITENGDLFDFPLDTSAIYRIRKPNGEINQNNAFINLNEHKIIINLKFSDLSIPGRCYADIVISDGAGYISTVSFILNVQASPDINVSGSDIISLQRKTATENGQVIPDYGYDGLSSVYVEVSEGVPYALSQLFNPGILLVQSTGESQCKAIACADLTSNTYGVANNVLYYSNLVTDLSNLKKIICENTFKAVEWYGCVTNELIDALGLVELGRNTNSGSSMSLSDSINNYVAIIAQGVYMGTQVSSNYNTTRIYTYPQLNTQYWAGMKDRNSNYNRYFTFTGDTTVTLSGGSIQRGIIIWGMPYQENIL